MVTVMSAEMERLKQSMQFISESQNFSQRILIKIKIGDLCKNLSCKFKFGLKWYIKNLL
jgi:hypothetical protein